MILQKAVKKKLHRNQSIDISRVVDKQHGNLYLQSLYLVIKKNIILKVNDTNLYIFSNTQILASRIKKVIYHLE